MAVKISELTASSGLSSTDILPVVDASDSQTQKATFQQVLNYVTGSTFNTLTVTQLTATNSQLTGAFSGTFVGDGSGLTGLPADNFTLGSTNIVLGTTASILQGLSVITGSTVTGSTALFNNLTASTALFSGDIRVLGTASINHLNTVNQTSLIIGDKYITILSGGVDHTGINGAGILWGTSSGTGETTGALGEHAHILYDSSRDALEIFPGLYVTGSTTLFDVSGTTAQFTTISASVVSASSYIGVPATTPGGTNQTIQFNSGSTFSGSTNLVYSYTTNTLSGTTAQFTTLSASSANISGALFVEGPINIDQFPNYAYIVYSGSYDKLVVSPGLYVSGNLTGSELGAFQTVSASTGLFTTISASVVSASSYVGLPTSSGGTPGGADQTVQFNSGSTFSGSTNLIYNYINNTLSGTTAQFTTISASVISASSYVGLTGGGDVSSVGNNTFTGINTFNNNFITASVGVTGSTAQFTTISASVVSASSYVGLPTSSGGTPGGTNQTVQFNSGSTFSGSTNLTWDYTNNVLYANVGGFLTIGSSGLQLWKNSTPTHAGNIGLSIPGVGITNDTIISTYQDGPGWSERLRVTNADGNVGIGVSNPNYKLEVNGEIAIQGGESPNDDRIHIKASDNTVRYTIKTDLDASPSNDLLIFRASNTDNILTLKGNGNVGINKSSPNSILDVNGNTIISGNLTVTGSISELSTRRIKTNIQTLTEQLTEVSKLNPVSYVRLDNGRKEYGFISEEVKEIYPEFVVGEGINYPKMVSVLVSAVKELTHKVQQQQIEIELIKKRGEE